MARKQENVPVESRRSQRELAPRGPASIFDELRSDVENFWMRGGWPFPLLSGLARRGERWLPSTDVYRENGTLVVKADVPGLSRDDVHVTLDNGDLVIEGERRQENKVDDQNYFRTECSYGSFFRRIPLPEGVEPSDIEAKLSDGVLEVRVPVSEAASQQPQKIEVR